MNLIAALVLLQSNQKVMLPNFEKLTARIERAVEKSEVAGASVVIYQKGSKVYEAYRGYADLAEKKPLRPDTVYQVMSMTKPVVAIAVMQCVEDGLLNLDDPVEKYLPAFKTTEVSRDGKTEKPSRKVTIRHLLTHTSGLSGDDPKGLDDDTKRKMTLGEYAALIGTEPLRTNPGEQIRYSGVGINAAARIVEIVSGSPFETYCQTRIFRKCGMENTWFFLPEAERSRLAKTYYTTDQGGLAEFEHDRFRAGAKLANGAGGLYSTLGDMAKLLLNYRKQGGKLVSPATFRAMTTVQTGDLPMDGGTERGFGLGWSVVRNPAGTAQLRSPGSYGHTGAFVTEFWVDPKLDVVYVYMSQGFGAGDEVRKSATTIAMASFR